MCKNILIKNIVILYIYILVEDKRTVHVCLVVFFNCLLQKSLQYRFEQKNKNINKILFFFQ